MLDKIKTEITRLLSIKSFRIIVGKTRFYYFYYILRRLNILESDFMVPNTIEHNLKSLSKFGFTRMDKLIRPLSVIELLNKNSKFLIIGPRNEEDLLNLAGHGFDLKNIVGLDLISYSKNIKIGDMHDLPFDDNQFDSVLCGWTIAYSTNQIKAAKEMVRVLKPSGLIAVSLEYSTLSNEDQVLKLGYNLNDTNQRPNSVEALLSLFEGHVEQIYFQHDAPNKISHSISANSKNVSAIVVIFSITK